eukprot:707961-Alexandrium_andersonii.AAC.1
MSPFTPFDDWKEDGKLCPRTNACGRVGGPGYELLIVMDSEELIGNYNLFKTQAGVINTRDVIDARCFT